LSAITVGVTAPIPAGAGPDVAAGIVRDVAEAGVDHLVVGDHVTFFGGFGVDGLVHAGCLLMLHPVLPVHTSVYLLPLRHPVLVARQLSTISTLAPGRLVLGVGIGGEDRHEVSTCGVDPRTRGRRMDECMQIVQGLQTGGPMSYAGEFFVLDEVVIRPAPEPPVPLVVGGRSDAAVRRAGRVGDGWLGIWVSPERFATAVALAEEEAAAAGRTGVAWRHGMTVWCGFGDDSVDGAAAVAPVMEGIYGVPFERFDRYVPRGTPAQVADMLGRYVDAGCRSFNLLAQAADRSRIIEAAGEVRGRLADRAG
jgi:alkanesulfonate monooxygenase SsuD/methylene tetrahydromethanopterin reductase-like flavin-dependent oxidoreductase (luciferase family)